MKHLFSWAVASLFLLACNENKQAETVTEAPATTTTPGPAEFADARYSEIAGSR